MSREELVAEIEAAAGATAVEQTVIIDSIVNDIVLGIQLMYQSEILISEMNADNIADIKREALRRYRYG